MAKTNLKLASSRDGSREALAAAIDDEAVARKNLDDARSAAEKARGLVWAAEDRLAALREDAAQAQPAGALIASLAAGNADIAELERPQVETSAKLEGAEQEVSAWRRAREAADNEIAPREKALQKAQRRIKDAVEEVMRTVDIDAIIARAERARDTLIAERCRLAQICEALPWFSEERKAVESFLSHPFLAHEAGDGWKDHAAVEPWRAAVDALHRDPDAALPAIEETESTVVVLPANGRD